MARFQITGTAIYGAMLRMSKINSFGARDFQPFQFNTMAEARAFYDAEKVDPYEDTFQTMVAAQTVGEKTVTKYFRKDGPLEMMLPFDDDQWMDGTEGHQLSVTGHGALEGLISIEVVNKRALVIDVVPQILRTVNYLQQFIQDKFNRSNIPNLLKNLKDVTQNISGQIDQKESNIILQSFLSDLRTSVMFIEHGHYDREVDVKELYMLGKKFLQEEMAKIKEPNDIIRAILYDFFLSSNEYVDVFLELVNNPSTMDNYANEEFENLYHANPGYFIHDIPLSSVTRDKTIAELRTDLFLQQYDHVNGMSRQRWYDDKVAGGYQPHSRKL